MMNLLQIKKIDTGGKTNILLPLPAVEKDVPLSKPIEEKLCRGSCRCAESQLSLRGCSLTRLLLLRSFMAVGVALYCHPLDVRFFYST